MKWKTQVFWNHRPASCKRSSRNCHSTGAFPVCRPTLPFRRQWTTAMLGKSPGQIQFAEPSIEPGRFAVLLQAPHDQQLSTAKSSCHKMMQNVRCQTPGTETGHHRGTMDQNNAPMLATQVPTKIRNWRNNETLWRGWCPATRVPRTLLTLSTTRYYPCSIGTGAEWKQ